VQIIASAPQPAGYLTIIQDSVPSRGRCACGAGRNTSASTRRTRFKRPLAITRRLIRQPLMEVLGLLAVAAAAKSGFGGWAAGGILTLLPI
jgi:hypothetical protein